MVGALRWVWHDLASKQLKVFMIVSLFLCHLNHLNMDTIKQSWRQISSDDRISTVCLLELLEGIHRQTGAELVTPISRTRFMEFIKANKGSKVDMHEFLRLYQRFTGNSLLGILEKPSGFTRSSLSSGSVGYQDLNELVELANRNGELIKQIKETTGSVKNNASLATRLRTRLSPDLKSGNLYRYIGLMLVITYIVLAVLDLL
ncbi:unnamed protein product [Kuraishia capsulata CBS 1993]|uniref:Uncharacterized protein n=1 Tax=Kuraishia capsulata CBS 1993 TaxID=1382522 RepID=W6MP46_9ASCO|nr:uncharacterized protein KUCA_T00004431001 [Kuraishia capsulata CBS 1993]CDK28449.1 unnamed protein product [Kuraishia capsulata CBS 1993]